MSLKLKKHEHLKKLYYDKESKVAYSSFPSLYRYVKRENKYFFSPAEVRNWLSQQDVYTKFRKSKRGSSKNGKVHIFDKGYMIDVDTGFINQSQNMATNKFLLAIDAHSKKIAIYPIRKLTGENVIKGLEKIFQELGRPSYIRSDYGSEYRNVKVKDFLEGKKVEHIFAPGPNKSFFSERAIRSYKRLLTQLLHSKNQGKSQAKSWLAVYKDAEKIYNNRFHSSIGMSPNEASDPENRAKVLQYIKRKALRLLPPDPGPFKYDLGETVRVRLDKKGGLMKDHTQSFSNEIYQIVDRFMRDNVHFYKLRQLNYGTPISGTFKNYEIVPAIENEEGGQDSKFLTVDQVLKASRTINNIKYKLVKWKEINSRSYIPEKYLNDANIYQRDRLVMPSTDAVTK